GMSTVIEAVNFTLSDGAKIDPTTGIIQITMSYANGRFGSNSDPSSLDVFVSPPTASASHTFFGMVRDGLGSITINQVAKTVTYTYTVGDLDSEVSGSWLFVLAFPTGGGGGGGGGIVSPGLVLNVVAGVRAAGLT